jgi:hypothetical protein
VLLHGSAIRPVPPFARVSQGVLEEIERELGQDGEQARSELDGAFARFERTQPHLAELIAGVLAAPLEEPPLALGYFLSIVVWLAFERSFGAALGLVGRETLEATRASIVVEAELHARTSREPFEVGSILVGTQPEVASFVREHVTVALAAEGVDARGVRDVERAIVELTLALSSAVSPSADTGSRPGPD